MKNQSGTIKTNLELYRVVMGGSGGYRRLTGGSDDFLLQTNTQTDTHHNMIIVIIILTIIIIIVSVAIIIVLQSSSLKGGSVWGRDAPVAWFRGKWISVGERKIGKRGRKGLELLKNMSSSPSSSSAFISAQLPLC